MYNNSIVNEEEIEMTISTARIGELQQLGYYVEDMECEWGSEFVGQYRWMNDTTDEFQDCDTSCTVDEAWVLADQYEKSTAV